MGLDDSPDATGCGTWEGFSRGPGLLPTRGPAGSDCSPLVHVGQGDFLPPQIVKAVAEEQDLSGPNEAAATTLGRVLVHQHGRPKGRLHHVPVEGPDRSDPAVTRVPFRSVEQVPAPASRAEHKVAGKFTVCVAEGLGLLALREVSQGAELVEVLDQLAHFAE